MMWYYKLNLIRGGNRFLAVPSPQEAFMGKQKGSEKRSDRIIGRRYRYTADYRVVPGLGPNGSRERRVLYTAPWVVPVNDPAEYKGIVLRMRVLLALVGLAFLGAVTVLPTPMTHKWYLPLLMTALFPIAFQVMSLTFIPGEPKPLERQRFDKGFVRMGHSAMFAFVIMCLSGLGVVVYWLFAAFGTVEDSAPYALGDGLFALLLVVAAGAELTIYRLFGRIRTETRENTAAEV